MADEMGGGAVATISPVSGNSGTSGGGGNVGNASSTGPAQGTPGAQSGQTNDSGNTTTPPPHNYAKDVTQWSQEVLDGDATQPPQQPSTTLGASIRTWVDDTQPTLDLQSGSSQQDKNKLKNPNNPPGGGPPGWDDDNASPKNFFQGKNGTSASFAVGPAVMVPQFSGAAGGFNWNTPAISSGNVSNQGKTPWNNDGGWILVPKPDGGDLKGPKPKDPLLDPPKDPEPPKDIEGGIGHPPPEEPFDIEGGIGRKTLPPINDAPDVIGGGQPDDPLQNDVPPPKPPAGFDYVWVPSSQMQAQANASTPATPPPAVPVDPPPGVPVDPPPGVPVDDHGQPPPNPPAKPLDLNNDDDFEKAIDLAIANAGQKPKTDDELTQPGGVPPSPYDLKPMNSQYYTFDQNSNVHYLTPDELEALKLSVAPDGRIYQNGVPYDTSGFNNGINSREKDAAMFVMGPDGQIYARQQELYKVHHSSFLGGAPVAAAGLMVVKDGYIQSITNDSGHYSPNKFITQQVLDELAKRGYPTQTIRTDWYEDRTP